MALMAYVLVPCPAGKKIFEKFASLLELSRIGLVADFEDGIGQHLSAFRCRLRGGMEEIQERITHRPDLSQYQFGGISRSLSRSGQSGPAQPLGESLSSAFGGSFYLGSSSGVSRVAAVLVRKPGFASSPNGKLDWD